MEQLLAVISKLPLIDCDKGSALSAHHRVPPHKANMAPAFQLLSSSTICSPCRTQIPAKLSKITNAIPSIL